MEYMLVCNLISILLIIDILCYFLLRNIVIIIYIRYCLLSLSNSMKVSKTMSYVAGIYRFSYFYSILLLQFCSYAFSNIIIVNILIFINTSYFTILISTLCNFYSIDEKILLKELISKNI